MSGAIDGWPEKAGRKGKHHRLEADPAWEHCIYRAQRVLFFPRSAWYINQLKVQVALWHLGGLDSKVQEVQGTCTQVPNVVSTRERDRVRERELFFYLMLSEHMWRYKLCFAYEHVMFYMCI